MKAFEPGFNLIELMLATTLSLMILSTLIKIMVHMQSIYQYQIALSQIQESARSSISLLHNEVSMAGYIGCGHFTKTFPLINHTSFDFSLENVLKIDEHSISVKRADAERVRVNRVQKNNIEVARNSILKVGEVVLIANCTHAEIVKIRSIHVNQSQQVLMLSRPLSYPFANDAYVYPLSWKIIYTANSGRKNSKGDAINSLFIKDFLRENSPSEMVEGIESLKIKEEPQSVKVTLSITSVDPLPEFSQSPDHLIHKTWDTEICLQEKLS